MGSALQHWFPSLANTVSLDSVSPHQYGSDEPVNGLLYTCDGGFIDTDHLRDAADHTLYACHQARRLFPEGSCYTYEPSRFVGFEIQFKPVQDPPDKLCRTIGAAISYHIHTWHEIESWYLHALTPFGSVAQRFSSFSPEDNYSHMLGVTIGYEAAKKKAPAEFSTAADTAMRSVIKKLGPLNASEANSVRRALANDDRSRGWYPEHPPAPKKAGAQALKFKYALKSNQAPALFRRHFDSYAGTSDRMPGHVIPWLAPRLSGACENARAKQVNFPRVKYRGKSSATLFTVTASFGTVTPKNRALADLVPHKVAPGEIATVESADFPRMIREIRRLAKAIYGPLADSPVLAQP